MKQLLGVLGLLFLVCLTAKAQPKAKFDTKRYDYGMIVWKDPAKATFTITNTGNKPLVISNVTTSCGCAEVDWTKRPIAPGKKGVVSTVYDAKLLGHFNKSIGIYCNASNMPIYVQICGEVTANPKNYVYTHPIQIGDICLKTDEIEFADARWGDEPQVVLSIANPTKKPYTPVLMHLPPYLSMEAEPKVLDKGTAGKIKVTLHTKELPKYGITTAKVYLSRFLGDVVCDENTIPVSAVVLPDLSHESDFVKNNPPKIELSEQALQFGALASDEKKSGTLVIKNIGKSNLEIMDLQVFNSVLEIHLKKKVIKPGASTKMKVTAYGDGLRKLKRVPRILMITNDPKQPKVVLNVNVTPKI